MNLYFRQHIRIANKWLVLFSGINQQATTENGKKVYEAQYFNLPKKWIDIKWSKTMIKQFLAYVGMSDSQGDIGIIHLEELANVLNCSVRSLKNHNKVFEQLQFIQVDPLYGDFVHVRFVRYEELILDHYETKQGEWRTRTGYTRIDQKLLFELFKITNVNVLRLTCRALFLHEKEVNLGGQQEILFTSKALKGSLPSYFTYRPVIERALKQIEHLFAISFHATPEEKKSFLTKYKPTARIIEKFKSSYILSMRLNQSLDSRAIREEELQLETFSPIFHSFRQVTQATGMESLSVSNLKELVQEYGGHVVHQTCNTLLEAMTTNQPSSMIRAELEELRWNPEPIGLLRQLFKKMSMKLQRDYFATV